MDNFAIDSRWSKYDEHGDRDVYEWRDYFKDSVEWGRYQVWKNDRRTGWNYTPAKIEEMLDRLRKIDL